MRVWNSAAASISICNALIPRSDQKQVVTVLVGLHILILTAGEIQIRQSGEPSVTLRDAERQILSSAGFAILQL